ncbi:N-acetyltransferase family protein [Candidatus Lokiarchaeum ossiferum]
MNIRVARLEDALEIATVRVLSWKKAYRNLISDHYLDSLTIPERVPKWIKRINQTKIDPSRIFVIQDSDLRIVGYTWCGIPRNYSDVVDGELYAMYILPEYWQQGIGTQLFFKVVQYFEELGYQSMLIWALSQNSACEFYQKLGGIPTYVDFITHAEEKYEETGFVWSTLPSKMY